jgi:hypothetical protein
LILRKIKYFLLFICLVNTGYSQELTQTLRGYVIDTDTKKQIEGAEIIILNTNPPLAASSGHNGEYRIENVPLGRYSIKISHAGNDDQIIPDFLIKSGKEAILNIEMYPSLINLKAVEIITSAGPNNEMATVSTRTFSVEETKKYPASINDPSRMVMSFAGVSSGYDRDNEIVIRGNSPKGLLWQLEGVAIPSPNHFSNIGSSSGSVSMLSSTVLANSDFMTGGFPAEYGNATSGVFDIKFRNGNNEKREYTLQAGFLGLDIGAEGPFIKGKRASYLFNYRYSSTSVFNLLGYKVQGDAIPQFQDLSFKLFFPTEKAGVFSVYGLSGLSNVSQTLNTKKEGMDYNLGIGGISHQLRITDKTFIKTTLSFSGNVIHYRGQEKVSSVTTKYYIGDFTDFAPGLTINITSRVNSKNVLKAGLCYSKFFYDYYSSDTYSSIYNTTRSVWMNENGNTDQTQAFVSWKYRINNKLSLVNGLHFLHLKLNEHYTIEPRSAVKWQINPVQSLSFAFGMHSKSEPFQTYLDRSYIGGDTVQLNQNIDFTKSLHYILSFDRSLTENLYLKAEVYYQHLYNVPVSADTSSNFSTLNTGSDYSYKKLSNEGFGRNYGIEITIDKKFSKNYFFLITASLFESKYTAGDKIERNTLYNTNYVSNYILGKELWLGHKKKNMIGASIRVNWTGGRRYTPIDLERSRLYNYEIHYNDRDFESKMPDYFRIDLQIRYTHNHPKFNSELRLDIQNVTNRKNVFDIYYDPLKKEIRETYQLGFIPSLSYRIEF